MAFFAAFQPTDHATKRTPVLPAFIDANDSAVITPIIATDCQAFLSAFGPAVVETKFPAKRASVDSAL